jgi:hypothetical protein
MEQDKNLESRISTITIKEQKTEADLQKEESLKKLNLFSKDVLENTKITLPSKPAVQSVPNAQNKNSISTEGLEKIKEHIKASHYGTYTPEEKELVPEPVQEEPTIQTEHVEEVEEDYSEQIESLYSTSLSIESTNDEQLEEELNSYSKNDTKSYKFRFRLLTGVFCCLLALLGGWIIGNVVEITSTNAKITTATEYSVNLKDLISNISRTDQNETPASPSDGTLLPIEEIIPITPLPLDEPTSYEEESNWFDKVCNWFNNIFGG